MVFSPDAIAETLKLAPSFWDPQPRGNILRLQVAAGSRLIIVGDTHGQLEDVLWIFCKYGRPSATNQYFFNGDIVDRGGHALEILLLLFAFKRDVPNSVHMQRGNHEDAQVNILFGFKNEVCGKLGESGGAILHLCQDVVFPLMPLASLVSDADSRNQICILHGGPLVDCGYSGPLLLGESKDPGRPCLAHMSRTRQSIQVRDDEECVAMFHMLWADPADSPEQKSRPSQRGNMFVEADTRAFCQENNVSFLVRSHEVPKDFRGLSQRHGGLCCTVFSASNYMGHSGNRGGVLICEGCPLGFESKEHWAPPWPHLAECCQMSDPARRAQAIASWESQFGISKTRGGSSLGGEGRRAPAEGGGREHADRSAKDPGRAASPAPEASRSRPPTHTEPRAASEPPPLGTVGLMKPEMPERAAAEQRKQFLMDRVVEFKEPFYEAFCSQDKAQRGAVSLAQWFEVMQNVLGPHCPGFLTKQVLEEFAAAVCVSDPVEYCRFLHRFQIRSEEKKDAHADAFRRMTVLRYNLADLPDVDLKKLLDPNGDKLVSREEFLRFLLSVKVPILPWQSAALYETMVGLMKEEPLKLDRVITCVSVMGRSTPSGHASQWSPVAQQVGKEMHATGQTIPWYFRRWDVDRDGYLSLEEIEKGLATDLKSLKFSREQVSAFVEFIDSMGVANSRVSLVEFVRALTPYDVCTALQKVMIKEVLKRVWIGRPLMLTYLAQFDAENTNKVTVKQFKEGIEELNRHFQKHGRPPLSETQVNSICEIASGGHKEVGYSAFLNSLHVVDTGVK